MENSVLQKTYSITAEAFENGFRMYQKLSGTKRLIITAILMAFVIVIQVRNIILERAQNPALAYLIVGAALGLIIVEADRPRKVRKRLMESIKGIETDVTKFTLYDDKITLYMRTIEEVEYENNPPEEENKNDETSGNYDVMQGYDANEEQQQTVLKLDNKFFKIAEKEDLYLLMQGNIMVYIVPKYAFEPNEIQVINQTLMSAMGERFNGIA